MIDTFLIKKFIEKNGCYTMFEGLGIYREYQLMTEFIEGYYSFHHRNENERDQIIILLKSVLDIENYDFPDLRIKKMTLINQKELAFLMYI